MWLRQAKDRFTASFQEATQEDGAGPLAWGQEARRPCPLNLSLNPAWTVGPTWAGAFEPPTHQMSTRGRLTDPPLPEGSAPWSSCL